MPENRSQTLVIGAGIVGIATAIWLRRLGHDVTVMDRTAPGMGASYGNAGVLASCAIVPITTPGLIHKIPKYLLNPDFPLFLRWSYTPRLLPFLIRYLSYANDTDVRQIAEKLHFLTHDSVAQHRDLVGNSAAGIWIQDSPYAFIYKDRAAFKTEHYVWSLRAKFGFVPEILDGPAVQEYQPALHPSLRCMAIMHDHGFVLNPQQYVQSLSALLCDIGGRVVQANVQDFVFNNGVIAALDTDQGRFPCDSTVVATGAFSKSLMQKLGLDMPLESERGYHILYKNAREIPTIPIMLASGKFVATPMEQGLRCAGVVEFGGLEAGPSPAPLALLRRQTARTFPNMIAEAEEEWLGHRPTLPDSLPVIGEIDNSKVYTAFGHQHVGLTAGAKSGRLLAEIIAERPLEHDLAPFSPDRYKKSNA